MSTIEGLIRTAVRTELQQLEERLTAVIRAEIAAAARDVSCRPASTTRLADPRDASSGVWLTTAEAAALLALSPKTLANWRALGQGPAYRRAGRVVRYDRAVVGEFMV
ncbi:helix-turn-helix domain-containing protein [Microbacterium sp.]|uniref:helix-turn-helix domain-containing protein n=1 Tax=Microbacterium sp. TaxID=51671 RepID=UPI003C7436A2